MSEISVREVHSKKEWKIFKNLPWLINKTDSNWVPPLRLSLNEIFDLSNHPFWKTVDSRFYLAYIDGEVVGRIAAIIDRNNPDNIGNWGFIEAKDDPGVFRTLLDTVESFLNRSGCKKMVGPLNPGINYELGVLIEGFHTPPYFMLSHNPPYYDDHILMAGHQKEKDFYSYLLKKENYILSPKVKRAMELVRSRGEITVRAVDMKRLDEEVELLYDIYNDAFRQHWGFTEMTIDEFRFMAKDLNRIVDKDLVLIIYYNNVPAGFLLSLPNINDILIKIRNGRLFPTGIIKYLYYKNKIRALRIITIAIREKYQHLGLGSLLYEAVGSRSAYKGYVRAELSWVIEDNIQMNKVAVDLGAEIYKKYRIYSREINQ